MDAKAYSDMLDGIKNSSSLLMCEYCGTETASMGDKCMCSNCEELVTTNRASIEKKDHLLLDSLVKINDSIADQRYDDATAIYEKLIADRKDPLLMYAAAIAYFKHSNYEIMQISYMQPNFMEGNTLHRDKAASLVSTAKRHLFKAIDISNAEISKGNKSLNLVYNRFLAQIKLGNVRGAKDSIRMLEGLGNDYALAYSRMVFESAMERYDSVLEAAEALTKKDNFSINAFYYIGLALFKKRRAKDAKQLLQSLGKILKNGNLDALIFEVDYQLATWR
jgi:tetratricopeptide (TPR) repeat protein